MDQSLPVGRPEPFSHVQRDAKRLLQWQRTHLIELLMQRATVDKLHHEERDWVGVLDGADRNDVLMRNRGARAGFARKPLTGDTARGQGGGERLDGDDAM